MGHLPNEPAPPPEHAMGIDPLEASVEELEKFYNIQQGGAPYIISGGTRYVRENQVYEGAKFDFPEAFKNGWVNYDMVYGTDKPNYMPPPGGIQFYDLDQAYQVADIPGGYIAPRVSEPGQSYHHHYKHDMMKKAAIEKRNLKIKQREYKKQLAEIEREAEERRLADIERLAGIRAQDLIFKNTMKSKYGQAAKEKRDVDVAGAEPVKKVQAFNRRKWQNITKVARLGGSLSMRRPA